MDDNAIKEDDEQATSPVPENKEEDEGEENQVEVNETEENVEKEENNEGNVDEEKAENDLMEEKLEEQGKNENEYEEAIVETENNEENPNEEGERTDNEMTREPELSEDESKDQEEIDKEAVSSGGAHSPTSEKARDVIKKRPPRRKHNDDMIAEEENYDEGEGYKSPGPPVESISHHLEDNDRMIAGHEPEILKPTTPDKFHHHLFHEEDNEQIIEEPEIKLTREEIIAQYHAAAEERDKNQNLNNQLHHKLADYFRKRQKDDAQSQQMFDKTSQDQEQRYMKYLTSIEELHKQLEKQKDEFEEQKYELKKRCEEQQKTVQIERAKYVILKKETALKAVNSHTGKTTQPKEIEEYFEKEKLKEQEVVQVRLENIKLKNQLKKKENQLRAKEELGEGLHLIDFEQLKIENQTYNEKIEERNEELMKLKRKINETVQTLTHVKEKLKFVSAQNEKEKDLLNISENEVKKKRDRLNRIKQSRDSLRLDNNKLKQNSGLLGNTSLLRDFEECVDNNEDLQSKIEHLKQRHAELILDTRGLKQKIMQAKSDK